MSARAAKIVDLNLLPKAQRPIEVSGWAGAIVAVFAIAILGLAPVAVYAQKAEDRAQGMERRADESTKQLRNLQLEFIQARALRVEIDDLTARATTLTDERNALQQSQRPLNEDVSMIYGWGFLPSGATITRVTGELDTLSVEGTAANPLDAIAYAEQLVTAGGFPAARVASYAPGPGGGIFTVQVSR